MHWFVGCGRERFGLGNATISERENQSDWAGRECDVRDEKQKKKKRG